MICPGQVVVVPLWKSSEPPKEPFAVLEPFKVVLTFAKVPASFGWTTDPSAMFKALPAAMAFRLFNTSAPALTVVRPV